MSKAQADFMVAGMVLVLLAVGYFIGLSIGGFR